MAEGTDEVWRRKLVVKGLPPCTTDLITNYLEVISALCVSEEDGVTFHEGITHTAMVTFTEELTEKDFQKILTQGKQKPLEGKQLTFQRLTEPTSSMLVRNVPSGLTRDNLMYYFESRHAGCHDGEVENCEVDYDGGFAVIKFSSSEVARAVMVKQEHVPAKGTVVQVEPYFPEFHESILKELKNLERTSWSKKPQQAADGQKEHCVTNKGPSYAKSPLLPTPSYETRERTNPLWETSSHYNSSRETFLEDSTFTESTEYHDSRGNVFSEEYNQRGSRGRRRSRNKNHRGRARGKSPRNSWSDCSDPNGFEESVCEPQFQRGRRPGKYQIYHQRDFATDENFQERNKSYRPEHTAKWRGGSEKRHFMKQSSSDHGPKVHYSVSRPVITLDADCNFVAVQSPPAPVSKCLDRFPRNEKENDSDFFDSELIKYPEPTSEVDEESSDIQESAVSRSSFTNPQKSEETEILQQELENKSTFEKQNEIVQNPDELMKNKKLEEENERLKKELEKLKSQKAEKIEVPGYKLCLLSNFSQECKTCSVTFFEHEGKVQFSGSEDGCLAARVDLLSRIQVLADDTTHLPADITSILQTAKGQMYLSDIKRTYPGCSVDLQGQVLMCASHKMEEVQSFLQEIKRNIIQEDIQLRITEISSCPEFPALKKRLEEDLMVKVTLSDSGTVTVHGINGDVHMAKRDITDYVERQKPGRKIFQIQGFLAARACRQWFSTQLFDARDLIIKNGKILQEQESEGRYMLQYECQQSMLDSVERKLDSIKNNIHSAPFDLKHPFQSKTDYALVVNGLYTVGLKQYCAGLEQTLQDQRLNALVSISLPPKCHLPKFRFKVTQRDKKIQSLPKRTGRWTGHKRYRHRSYHQRPFNPYAISIGPRATSVTIQSGDITVEAVDALVSVVGDDLDLKGTAVGGAILKKCPTAGQLLNLRKLQVPALQAVQLAQMVPQQPAAATGVQVIPTQLPLAQSQQNQLQTSYILHAVIARARSPQNVTSQVKTIVEECLQLAVRSGKTSIAFPPIGAGRKFQFPEDTVVAVMISTITQFLSSQRHALQSVKIVIYDKSMAKKFKDSLKKQTSPSVVESDEDEEEDHSVDSDDDDDNAAVAIGDVGDLSSNDSDSESQLIGLEEDQLSSNEEVLAGSPVAETTGSVCTLRADDIPRVRKAIVEDLKAHFLCQETVPNMETITKLSQKDCNEIEDEAVKNHVVLTMQKTSDGKQKLVLRGQHQGMSRTVNFISEKVMTQLKKMKDQDKHRRSKGTLDKHEFPTYWKTNEMGDIQTWVRKHRTEGKLFTVNDKEKSAVEQLIKSTWMQQFVGAGHDGAGLSHQSIQVLKVERLENPDLWETYRHRRDRMYLNHGSSHVQPIEKLAGSKKPVLTTANMPAGNPLRREIYPLEVNEHYLFHGTKKEYITNILASGLDNRIASDKAMLGCGVYAAESATKADQYTDDKRQRTSGHKTMILMRVLLGEPYINTSKNPAKFKRPPCKNCTKDICSCNTTSFYDSVIDDAGRNFREFVIYEACMCYPEYFITYQRV